MTKLDKIFSITDTKERQKELCEYARTFNINLSKVKNETGEVDENKLAVLIYEAKESQAKRKNQAIMIIGLGAAFLIACVIAIYVVSQIMAGLSRG